MSIKSKPYSQVFLAAVSLLIAESAVAGSEGVNHPLAPTSVEKQTNFLSKLSSL